LQIGKSIRFKELSEQRIYIIACAIVLLFAAFTRFAYVESISGVPTIKADAMKYYSLAHNILNEGSYSQNLKNPRIQNTFITPGYPLFLVGTLSLSNSVQNFFALTVYLQAILSALGVLLFFMISKKFLPYWGALFASLLVGSSPQLIVSNGYLLTESLFTFFLLLSVFILLHALSTKKISLFFLFGLVAGYASLVRPAYLLFPFIVILLPLATFRLGSPHIRMRAGAFIIAGVLIFWGPWLIFKEHIDLNKTHSHSAFVDSLALGSYPDLTFHTRAYRGYPYLEDPKYKKMQQGLVPTLKIVSERAREKPLAYLKWYFIDKPLTYWQWGIIVGAGGPFIYPVSQSIYDSNLFAITCLQFSELSHPLWLISALAVIISKILKVGRTRKIDENDSEITIIATALVYFTLVHSVLAPLPRYSYPMLPLLYLAAIYGLWRFATNYRTILESVYSNIRTRIINLNS
jgi:4-amino-4-deoxy-L-arabinose transferase-like glycosyltransferase